MEIERSSPPAYVSHNPADLHFPPAPQTEITNTHAHAEITLPDLKTVLSPDFTYEATRSPSSRTFPGDHAPSPSVRSLPPMDPGPNYIGRVSTDSVVMSPSEAGSAMSLDDKSARPTSVSMDDPDVRIAAEALSGLGNPDFVRSPGGRTFSHPSSAAIPTDPEPLFQLFTKAHPWVGGTINGSLNAYSMTKNYSPRFVQAGATIVEQRIGNPMANTVSKVGRITGVESGLRWYYGGSNARSSEAESADEASRRGAGDQMDLEAGPLSPPNKHRRDSQESNMEYLPAYRASKPPSYREGASPREQDHQLTFDRPPHTRSWSSQVFVSTSGLGVALSVTSRRTLGLCLKFLAQQAYHVTTLTDALKRVLSAYDQAQQQQNDHLEAGPHEKPTAHDENVAELATKMKQYSDDIWRTLEYVVTSVSNYAGGALPENARHFVRDQLMSLPQRWRVVSAQPGGEGEVSRGGHRMIAFATEGLDMISQVSQTMKLTLDSAEGWLQRVGRRREGEGSEMRERGDMEKR